MDKFRSMKTFVRIAELGSLTAAAAALDSSLPTVVRALADLERGLGVRLINRTTRRLHLTDEGLAYFERTKRLLADVEDTENVVTDRQSKPVGRLGVTAPVMFGRLYVLPIVNAFVTRFSLVSVDFMLLDRVVDLIEEGLDVGIRIGRLQDSSLIAAKIGDVRRVVVASPQYVHRFGTPQTVSDIRTHRVVRCTNINPSPEWEFGDGRDKKVVPLQCTMNVNQVEAALDACIGGLGLGMFLSYQVAHALAEGTLARVLQPFESAPIPVQIVYPHARLLSARVKLFVDHAMRQLRKTDFS
jgi:DNA-binding transcriptional LysR family regulator